MFREEMKKIYLYCPSEWYLNISHVCVKIKAHIFSLFYVTQSLFIFQIVSCEITTSFFCQKDLNRYFFFLFNIKGQFKVISLYFLKDSRNDDRLLAINIWVSINFVTHPCFKFFPKGVISCINFYFHYFFCFMINVNF